MAGSQNYAATATVGAAILQAGDASRIAPTAFGTIFTPSNGVINNGGQIERLVITLLGTTSATALRIFRFDGTTHHLYAEIPLTAATLTGSTASVATAGTTILEAVDNPGMFPILVPPLWTVRATINDTLLLQEAAVANIAVAQTTAGAANLLLNGSLVVAASAAAVASLQAPTAGTALTLNGAPYVLTNPALITITSATNLSTVGYRIVGRSMSGANQSELLTGPNVGQSNSVNAYKGAFTIIPNSTNAGTASVGYSTVAGTAVMPLPSQIMLTSAANLSAVNFTITGMTTAGVVLTEVLAGPNATSVLSVNIYAAVFNIATSAASGSVQVGTPAILSGVKIQAEGGSY